MMDPSVIREVPEQPWLSLFGVALVSVALGIAGWESHVRGLGYGPSLDDTPNLWAPVRARAVGAKTDQVVFVGASRTLFDMDLTVFQEIVGGPLPVQLATVGSNPLIILEDLANDPSYAGTTIVDAMPGLLAAAAGPPVASPKRYVSHYHKWSVADRWEQPLAEWLELRFAFINQDELTLSKLIDRLDLAPRPNVYAPRMPGYLSTVDENRQGRMRESIATDPAAAAVVQQTWVPFFSGPPKPAVFTDEQWKKMLADGWESNLARVVKSVEAIRGRGGKVIFSLLPSTGEVKRLEDKGTPRVAFWDRILRETGAPGVHFEDHPELQGFRCPEWSHLDGAGATEYTRRFARILKSEGLL